MSLQPGIWQRERVRWALLIAAVLVLLLLNLGNRGLNEPDEGRYANIASEMLESEHGWWEPEMSDFAHYDKPPLIYWLTAISFQAFGSNEWAARLPSVLGAIMALAGVGWTAARLYGNRVAWWTVLCCATLGQFWILARMLTPDMLLTGFVTLAIGFWAEEYHRGANARWWWGCAACWVLAWWTKATASLVPLLGLTCGLLLTKNRLGLRALRPVRLFLLVVAAGAPWYLDLMHHHPELRSFFFGRELAGRIVGHPDGRHGPIYYHAAFSIVGWMPWWPMVLVLLALHRLEIKNRFQRLRWQAVPLEAWVVLVGMTVFSLMSSKLVTYTLPFAPWAALFCARVLLKKADQSSDFRINQKGIVIAGVFVTILIAASFVVPQWQSRIGVSSTLRDVSQKLRDRNAMVVYEDRYSPGLEFYFGESVFYVTEHIPREIPSDKGFCKAIHESHFIDPSLLVSHLQNHRTNDVWFVRYKGRSSSPLTTVLQGIVPTESLRVGDFVLDRIPATAL